ncbi:unnamed protein product [Caenorhabditis brenneri]
MSEPGIISLPEGVKFHVQKIFTIGNPINSRLTMIQKVHSNKITEHTTCSMKRPMIDGLISPSIASFRRMDTSESTRSTHKFRCDGTLQQEEPPPGHHFYLARREWKMQGNTKGKADTETSEVGYPDSRNGSNQEIDGGGQRADRRCGDVVASVDGILKRICQKAEGLAGWKRAIIIHQFTVMQFLACSYFRMFQRLFGFFKIITAMTQYVSAATGSAFLQKQEIQARSPRRRS